MINLNLSFFKQLNSDQVEFQLIDSYCCQFPSDAYLFPLSWVVSSSLPSQAPVGDHPGARVLWGLWESFSGVQLQQESSGPSALTNCQCNFQSCLLFTLGFYFRISLKMNKKTNKNTKINSPFLLSIKKNYIKKVKENISSLGIVHPCNSNQSTSIRPTLV